MKKLIIAIIGGLLVEVPASAESVTGSCITNRGDLVRVGTYNIRYSGGASIDATLHNDWAVRREDVVRLVRRLNLDVFGLQEVCPDQACYLREKLPCFEFVGDHRGADRKSDEASPVFYRKDRFVVIKCGTFWLSETPEVPGSKSWGAGCPRVCSYLILKDCKTDRQFCFANTHTDHASAKARENGMRLIIGRMKEFGGGAPIVFVGDHNNTEVEVPARSVSRMLNNALYVSEKPPVGPWRTYNGWQWVPNELSTADALTLPKNVRNAIREGSGLRIDYIWVSENIRVLEYATHEDSRPGLSQYPSDHFPVTATIQFL